MLLMIRSSPPVGGERGSAVLLAYWAGLEEVATGGGEAAAERSIFKCCGGMGGTRGTMNPEVLGENIPPGPWSGASRTKTRV